MIGVKDEAGLDLVELDREIPTNITPTTFQAGRFRFIICGQGWLKADMKTIP